MKLSWIAVGFAIVASIIQSFAPLWVFLPVIIISISSAAISLWITNRQWQKEQLLIKMEAAFGKPNEAMTVHTHRGHRQCRCGDPGIHCECQHWRPRYRSGAQF